MLNGFFCLHYFSFLFFIDLLVDPTALFTFVEHFEKKSKLLFNIAILFSLIPNKLKNSDII
jgi:hypothetical protein